MKRFALAGVCLAALLGQHSPAKAQAQAVGMTVVAGSTCPTSNVLAVGNARPLIGTQFGALCTAGSGGGGGGGAVTIADGADVALGAKVDAATCATTNSLLACARQLHNDLVTLNSTAGANAIVVGPGASGSPVSGNPVRIAGSDGTNTQDLKVNPNSLALLTTETPATTGGLSAYTVEPGASDNHAVVKNGAGQVYHIVAFNNSATINYGRLYNAGTGFNGCSSATNLVWEFHIPANTNDAGFIEPIPEGLSFSTGIAICITGGYGQTNTTAATASAISLNIGYK